MPRLKCALGNRSQDHPISRTERDRLSDITQQHTEIIATKTWITSCNCGWGCSLWRLGTKTVPKHKIASKKIHILPELFFHVIINLNFYNKRNTLTKNASTKTQKHNSYWFFSKHVFIKLHYVHKHYLYTIFIWWHDVLRESALEGLQSELVPGSYCYSRVLEFKKKKKILKFSLFKQVFLMEGHTTLTNTHKNT